MQTAVAPEALFDVILSEAMDSNQYIIGSWSKRKDAKVEE